MNTIHIRYEALSASWVGDAVTGQEKTLKCKFIFDKNWDAYPIRYMIISREGKIFDPVTIDESNEAIVRAEALTERAHIMIGAVGLAVKNGETLRYNGRPCRIRVDQGNLIWEPSTEEEATAYEKLLVEVIELEKAVAAKLDSNQGTANAGRVLVVGEDGNVTPTDWVQPDWDQNDSTAKDYVKNRPIWQERRVVCDILAETPAVGEIVQIYSGNVSSITKCLIDPNSSNPPDCFRMIFEVDLTVNGQTLHNTSPLNLYAQIGGNNCLLKLTQFHVYVISDVSTLTEEYASKFSSAGIYIECWKSSLVLKYNNIEIYWALHHQLVEQYIPTTIARTADVIPLPPTASVGQTIKVSAVDADGKPTAWEAADPEEVWELLADVTLEEEVKNYEHSFDVPQRKLKVIVDSLAASANTSHSGFTLWFNNEAGSSYKPNAIFYPFPIPQTSVYTSVYNISTYYIGDEPCVDVDVMAQAGAVYGTDGNASRIRKYNITNLKENYFNKIMVPEIVKFNQNTYGTFAAGTRYRIYGVRA